jgi:hypothetical protein
VDNKVWVGVDNKWVGVREGALGLAERSCRRASRQTGFGETHFCYRLNRFWVEPRVDSQEFCLIRLVSSAIWL